MEIRFGRNSSRSIGYLIIRKPSTPSRIFGKYEERKLLDQAAAEQRFKREWIDGMQAIVVSAISREKDMSYQDAEVYLNEYEVDYLNKNKNAQRRSFDYKDAPFIVQFIEISPSIFEIDQIWYIHSHDTDKNLVCVSFDTKAELDAFHKRARQHGFSSGRKMLEEYVQAFMQS